MSDVSKNPLEEFTELYGQIKDKFAELPAVLSKLSSFSDEITKENSELKSKLKEIEEKFTKLKAEYEAKEANISEAVQNAEKYKTQLQDVEKQLAGLRTMYEELAQEMAADIEIKDLLAIYTLLFEKVFAADPVIKILILLQGVDKEEWTRDELVKTTNYTPAAVIRAIHDLRNHDIVETDESATKVKLIRSP